MFTTAMDDAVLSYNATYFELSNLIFIEGLVPSLAAMLLVKYLIYLKRDIY
jgi:uncharacterized membrane protein